MKTRVLMFGTFDGFDLGHEHVVSQAATCGDELIVAVARDAHVWTLKKKHPVHNETERLARVKQDSRVSEACLSDDQLGCYAIIDKVRPDLVVFGFDQSALKQDFLRWLTEQNRVIRTKTLEHIPE